MWIFEIIIIKPIKHYRTCWSIDFFLYKEEDTSLTLRVIFVFLSVYFSLATREILVMPEKICNIRFRGHWWHGCGFHWSILRSILMTLLNLLLHNFILYLRTVDRGLEELFRMPTPVCQNTTLEIWHEDCRGHIRP